MAGVWAVVFALGLAVVGVVLAVQQSRSLFYRLMAPAEAEAQRIAWQAKEDFDEQVSDALKGVEDHVTALGPQRSWKTSADFPRWIDGVFLFDGRRLWTLSPPSSEDPQLRDLIDARLRARLSRVSPAETVRTELLYDELGAAPVALACREMAVDVGVTWLAAVHIDIDALRTHLAETLLPSDGHLVLLDANAEALANPWSQRLLRAMKFWAIAPSEPYMKAQYRAVLGQTALYLGMTLLAVVTLLIAMAVLVRAVRREVALAEMKANFVADVSHELKTPLALIRMFGETLQSDRVTSEEKRQEYYAIITRESTRLTNLINNILDFAQIESGQKTYSFEPIDIAEVVRDTYEAYREQLDHDRFEHQLTAPDSLPLVNADRDAIAQVLINLIHNAVKYSNEERFLAIDLAPDTRRGRRGVLISVQDRGIGITPEDRAHLFDGFFRASDARVREKGGAGLGLAVVKRIVESHHGSLDVESRLVKGSTFRVFLPAWEGEQSAEH